MIDLNIIETAERELQPQFKKIEDIALFNQEKVLNAFKDNKIALRHFSGTSGYGYGDEGRDALNQVYAKVFGAEQAVCSPMIVSGTHALSLCLFGILRPNDKAVCITGKPYDTLIDVIYGKGNGSLKDYGVSFDVVEMKDGKIDRTAVKEYIKNNAVKMVYLQRSRGYEWRNALSIEEIADICLFLRVIGFTGCIMLDNCYGEFIAKKEPTEVGVDIMAGSLIKNVGGGIAQSGGYFAGKKEYVELVQNRLTAPSIGGEVGSYSYGYRLFYQGLFLAPHTVCQAVKGSLLFGAVLEKLGYKTSPSLNELPGDIIRAIEFGNEKDLVAFIQNIQYNSPIDGFVTAMPWDMPGYREQVIMAAGCFVQGSSIELSADAPIKPPYIAYMQGGLTYEHCKIALKNLKL